MSRSSLITALTATLMFMFVAVVGAQWPARASKAVTGAAQQASASARGSDSVSAEQAASGFGVGLYRPGTFRLTPSEYTEEIAPGESRVFDFWVSSGLDTTTDFSLEITGYGLDRRGRPFYLAPRASGDYSSASWVRLQDASGGVITANPGETKRFSVEVTVPYGTRPGEYYSTVFVQPARYSAVKEGALTLRVGSRIGAILVVRVPGTISAFDMRCSLEDSFVITPSKQVVDPLTAVIESIAEAGEIGESLNSDVARFMESIGYRFDLQWYRALEDEERRAYTDQILSLLRRTKMEMESILVGTTLRTDARQMVTAKGEAFVYQNTTDASGRQRRQLRDRFMLSPLPEIKGEAKILPGGMRDFGGSVERPLPAGDYTVELRFEYKGKDDTDARLVMAQQNFTITEELATVQKKLLLLTARPELLEYTMGPGGCHVEAITLENLDLVEPVDVTIISAYDWLEVSPTRCRVYPGRTSTIRVAVLIPRDADLVDRMGSVTILPDGGKSVSVDVRVSGR